MRFIKVHDIVYKISLQKNKNFFFENKLKECIGKHKDLRKTIKSLELPNKSGGYIVRALAENQIVMLSLF